MAKKSTGFREILTSIKKGEYANVYILMGDEPYYIDRIVKTLEDNVVAEDDRDFNLNAFYGNEIDVMTVIATAQQYPVMADRRLVLAKETQAMDRAKAQLEKFEDYVKRPSENTVLVIVYKGDSLNATSALLKAAAKTGAVVFKSEKLRDYELPVPVKEYCTSMRIGIDEASVRLLCDYCGSDLSKIFGEIDKLIVAGAGQKGAITPELIERNIGISKDYNNFELQKALTVKNYDKALRIIEYFSRNPSKNPTVMTIAMLFKFYSNLVIAHLQRDKSDSALMAVLQLRNSYALKEYKEALRHYSAQQAMSAVHYIRDFDRESKGVGSMQNEHALLRELIYKIFIAR